MSKQEKKIGIIGGVGPQATQFLYEKIIELSQTKYGAKNNDDYPRVIIESVPVPDFISDKKMIEPAKAMLIEATKALTQAGATTLAIGSNTVHILLDELQQQTDVPFISMIQLVAQRVKNLRYSKVGLLGTPVMLDSGIYTDALQNLSIETVLPTAEERQVCERMIRCVLAGTTDEKDKQAYINTLGDLTDRGAEGIILGCTELPLAMNYEALGNKIINSEYLLAEGLVDYYYS